MKPTRGPWRIKQWKDCTLAVESADGKTNICTMADDDDGGYLPDAILIAAAPELFAACKAVAACTCNDEDYKNPAWQADIERAMRKAAKAARSAFHGYRNARRHFARSVPLDGEPTAQP